MRRIICVPFLLAALTALSVLPVQDCLAYGPGDSWYYGHYRRGGPGVEYDYGTAPSGTYDYGLRRPRAMPGSPRIIRSGLIPALTLMCRTRPLPSLPPDTGGIPMTIIGTTGMTGTTRMTGGITTEGPEYSTARAGDTVPEAGGSSSMAAAGCQGGGSSYITDGTALTKMDIC